MRRTPRLEPPEPEPERPADWTPPEREDDECVHCGTTFSRHPDDPPTCSNRCWNAYLDESNYHE